MVSWLSRKKYMLMVPFDVIQRVVGLPGDKIQLIGGVLQINGEPSRRERVALSAKETANKSLKKYRETLPNGSSYATLHAADAARFDDESEFTVPEDHYFVLGDNRANPMEDLFLGGNDRSHFLSGNVSTSQLVGPIYRRVFPTNNPLPVPTAE
jgi:signal peptidase I